MVFLGECCLVSLLTFVLEWAAVPPCLLPAALDSEKADSRTEVSPSRLLPTVDRLQAVAIGVRFGYNPATAAAEIGLQNT
jgi:hypothetical protein